MPSAARSGQRLGPFGLAGVDPDLVAAPQRCPHLTDSLTNKLTNPLTNKLTSCLAGCLAYWRGRQRVGGGPGAQGEADRGVLGVGEPVGDVEVDVRLRRGPAGAEVQDATAADRGELMPITHQGDPGAHLLGNGEERGRCPG